MSIVLIGSTSGSVTLQEPAVAGSTVLDLPATSGTLATTGNLVLVKAHYFTNSTRVTVSSSANQNCFTWTSSFTPVNASTNDLYVIGVVPGVHAGQNYTNYGPRFSAGTTYDFQNIGGSYAGPGAYSAFQNYNFRIAAGTITNATYTITHRIYAEYSNMSTYNPTNADDGNNRLPNGSTSTLMILEYKNA
jgi:hypothetical protein